jgi:hypothetical protein
VRTLLAVFGFILLPSICAGQNRLTLQIIQTLQTENGNLALLEVRDAHQCLLDVVVPFKLPHPLDMCGTPFRDEFEAKLPVATFSDHYAGITLVLMTDDWRMFVVNCEKQRRWWGGQRACRMPTASSVTAAFDGWSAQLHWNEGPKQNSEKFQIKAFLFRPKRSLPICSRPAVTMTEDVVKVSGK